MLKQHKGTNPKGIEIYNNTGATLDFSATTTNSSKHFNNGEWCC